MQLQQQHQQQRLATALSGHYLLIITTSLHSAVPTQRQLFFVDVEEVDGCLQSKA
jgi:hypothetical protein